MPTNLVTQKFMAGFTNIPEIKDRGHSFFNLSEKNGWRPERRKIEDEEVEEVKEEVKLLDESFGSSEDESCSDGSGMFEGVLGDGVVIRENLKGKIEGENLQGENLQGDFEDTWENGYAFLRKRTVVKPGGVKDQRDLFASPVDARCGYELKPHKKKLKINEDLNFKNFALKNLKKKFSSIDMARSCATLAAKSNCGSLQIYRSTRF